MDSFYVYKNGNPHGACKKCEAAKHRAWVAANPDRSREMKREWRARNPERVRAYKATNYERHRESILAYTAEYFRRKPEARRKAKSAYRARRTAVSFKILPSELRRILSSACVACGSRERITIDHVVPLVRGGRHAVGNLQPLCHSCNSSKGAKLMIEWRRACARRFMGSSR